MKFIKLKKESARLNGKYSRSAPGFALILFLILMPLVLAGVYATVSVIQLTQTRAQLESTCLKLQNQSFYRQRQKLVQLLKLNPSVQKLIVKKIEVQSKVAAAIAAGQIELLPLLEAQREKIIIKQKDLAEKQNRLLIQSQEEFQRQQLHILKTLGQLQRSIDRSNAKIWQIRFSPLAYNHPHLAVQVTVPDIAPVYDLDFNFEEKQAWHIHWKMNIQLNPQLFSFLNFSHEVQHQCMISLKAIKNTFPIVVLGKS